MRWLLLPFFLLSTPLYAGSLTEVFSSATPSGATSIVLTGSFYDISGVEIFKGVYVDAYAGNGIAESLVEQVNEPLAEIVPEPSNLAYMAIGVAFLIVVARHRHQRKM